MYICSIYMEYTIYTIKAISHHHSHFWGFFYTYIKKKYIWHIYGVYFIYIHTHIYVPMYLAYCISFSRQQLLGISYEKVFRKKYTIMISFFFISWILNKTFTYWADKGTSGLADTQNKCREAVRLINKKPNKSREKKVEKTGQNVTIHKCLQMSSVAFKNNQCLNIVRSQEFKILLLQCYNWQYHWAMQCPKQSLPKSIL